jgi:DNA-binding NarL/FixJ family response regulator
MSITVFLADDHAIIREGLRMILETQADIRVLGGAADGREAVRLVHELKPDVVVMDISMPELNGIEATRQILLGNPDVRVVILSMHATSEYISRTLEVGASGYLLKESAGLEVIEAVRAAYEGQRYLSRRISDTLVDQYLRICKETYQHDLLETLSGREREVLQLVVEGKSSTEIAERLSLSRKTVETYRSRLMDKLGIEDLPGLVKFAIQHGIIHLE